MKKNVLLVNDTSLICHHGCTLLMSIIYKEFKKNNLFIKDKIYFEQNLLEFFDKNKEIYDIILINGEGTIHGKQNADKKKVNEILQFIKKIKKKSDTPIIIFNSSISSLNIKQLKILKLVNKIYVREEISYRYLKKNNIVSKIIPDFLSLMKFDKQGKGPKTIVTDSSIRAKTNFLREFSKENNFSYQPLLYNNYFRYLRFLIIKIFLPLRLSLPIKFFLSMKMRYVLKFLQNFENSKFVITGRFHAIFIAIAAKKPFYTFEGDTHKVRGLIKMIGLNSRIIDIKNLYNQSLTSNKLSEIEKKKIYKFNKNSKKLVASFFDELNNL